MRPALDTPEPGLRLGSARLVAAVTIVAGVLGSATILRHEWWRDETYVPLVVRASASPADLIAKVGFTGHPHAYFLLVYALHRLSASPLAVSISNLAFALLAIALLVRSFPFPPLHKALFAVGFFPLYQYGVIARNYSLFLVLLFLYAHVRVRWPKHLAARLVCLALLAQVHVMALAMAGVLAFLDLVELRAARASWTTGSKVAGAGLLLGIAGSVYQMLPRGHEDVFFGAGLNAFFGLANGFLPPFDRLSGPVQIGVGLVLCALSVLAVRADRRVLLRYALLVAPLFAISAVVYSGHRWHHGMYFVAFVVALWLGGAPPAPARRFLAALLALHAGVGLYAITEDLRRPYSNGEAAAQAILAGGRGELPIVGLSVRPDGRGALRYAFEIDRIQPVLIHLPDGRAYDPRAGTFERYWRHYSDPSYFAAMTAAELPARLGDVAKRLASPLLVVTVVEDLPEGADLALSSLRPLARFPRPLDYGERLELYLFPGD